MILSNKATNILYTFNSTESGRLTTTHNRNIVTKYIAAPHAEYINNDSTSEFRLNIIF